MQSEQLKKTAEQTSEAVDQGETPKQETETPKKETVQCTTCNTETAVGVSHEPCECVKVLVRDFKTYKDKSRSTAHRVCIAFTIGSCLLMLTMWELSVSWNKIDNLDFLVPPIHSYTLFGDKDSPRVEKSYSDWPSTDLVKTFEKNDLKSLRTSKIQWKIQDGIAGLRFWLTDGKASEIFVRQSMDMYKSTGTARYDCGHYHNGYNLATYA